MEEESPNKYNVSLIYFLIYYHVKNIEILWRWVEVIAYVYTPGVGRHPRPLQCSIIEHTYNQTTSYNNTRYVKYVHMIYTPCQ